MQLCLTQLASGPAGIYPYIRMEIRRYLQPGERIQLLAHKHALCLVRALVPPILLVLLATLSSWGYDLYLGKGQLPLWLLAVVALVAIAWGAYVWLDWSGKALIVTNSRVLWVEHVPGFKEKHWQSPLRGLQNVSASSRWLQRLVRSGDLLLDTRSEGALQVTWITRPHHIAARLGSLIRAAESTPISPINAGGETLPPLVIHSHPVALASELLRPLLLLAVAGLAGWWSGYLVVGIAGLCMSLLWAGWLIDSWSNHEITIDDEKIVEHKVSPLGLREETKSAPISSLQDMSYVIKSPLAYLLQYGDLRLQTAGDTENFFFRHVPSPRKLCDEIARRQRAQRRVSTSSTTVTG